MEIHHQERQEKPNDIKCEMCDFVTNRDINLKRHVKSTHIPKYDKECNVCEYKTYTGYQMTRHMKSHIPNMNIEKNIKCDQCDFASSTERGLKNHVERKHGKKLQEFRCESCKYVTTVTSYFKIHMQMHPKNGDTSKFICNLCEYETEDKVSLLGHKNIHRRYKKTLTCNKEKLECSLCNFETNFKNSLTRHYKCHNKSMHKNIKEFKCTLCNFETNVKESLKRHVKTMHVGVRAFPCPSCSNAAKLKEDLNRHIKRVHEESVGAFPCSLCPHAAKTATHVKRHMTEIHKGK